MGSVQIDKFLGMHRDVEDVEAAVCMRLGQQLNT